jgi:hypothetical protein
MRGQWALFVALLVATSVVSVTLVVVAQSGVQLRRVYRASAGEDEWRNVLRNPSFEQTSAATHFRHSEDGHYAKKAFAVDWEPFLNPYQVVADVAYVAERSALIACGFADDKFGFTQAVYVDDVANGSLPIAFVNVRLWTAAKRVSGSEADAGFALTIDFHFKNGSHSYGNFLALAPGTYDWRPTNASFDMRHETALSHIVLFVVFADRTGHAWIDDVFLSLNDDAPMRGAPLVAAKPGVLHTCCPLRETLPAEEPVARNSVSLVSQLTVDRLGALERMARVWQGPITAALYILRATDVDHARQIIAESPLLRRYATFVLVHASSGAWAFDNLGLYPINTLRNVALNATQSEFGLFLDVDFVTSGTAAEAYALLASRGYDAMMRERKRVVVLPAFELVGDAYKHGGTVVNIDAMPRSKSALKQAVRDGLMQQVHQSKYAPAHHATNYTRWYETAEPYAVVYEHEFEPYFIGRIADMPPWDERFIGYGYDKVVHVMTLAVQRFEIVVQPELFVTHLDHGIAKWRKVGFLLRLRVYQNYYATLEELYRQYGGDVFAEIL